jgi:hypothetical protein
MPTLSTASLVRALDARIKERSRLSTPKISSTRQAFRHAAAVLTAFDPYSVNPWQKRTAKVKRGSSTVLRPDLIDAPGGREHGLQMLRTDVRREALASLRTRDRMLRALDANPSRSQDGFQRMFDAWLGGNVPPLESQSYAELTWSAQIASWLEGLLPDLPSAAQVRRLLDRRSVYALFEHLAASNFTGRENELAALREHVGVLDPSTRTDAVVRQLRAWLKIERRPPLIIEGVGGIGKSALLARFLTEHMNQEEERRFPFSYLAFDNPNLRVEEPFTIIAEMLRQLRLLYPDSASDFESFSRTFENYRSTRGRLDEKSNIEGGRGLRAMGLYQTETDLYEQFGDLVNKLSRRNEATGVQPVPFLLVLDTFEEAQYSGPEALFGFFRLLGILQERCPYLRLVISARPPISLGPVESLGKPQALPMRELEPDAAALLLKRLGVEDEQVAETLVRQIGGNPLNLMLAGRLLQSENLGTRGIEGLKTSSWFLFSVSDETIRGQLYSRLLDHIHDERVRRLAHPGMVLRRVNPELILEVLSGPCEVAVKDIEEARMLCESLAREHTLVEREPDGTLSYRPDIRVPTLKLLQQDRPQQVRIIHEAAAEYYHRGKLPSDRIEELYHCLALDYEPELLDRRWTPDVASSLGDAFEEIPVRAQTWLAGKVGRRLSKETLQRATLEDWERSVAPKVRLALRNLDVKHASALLSERSERTPTSPLFALEAKACILEGKLAQADKILQNGIDAMAAAPNRGRLAELLWLRSQVLEAQAKFQESDESLVQAEQVAESIVDPLCRLQIVVQRLLLRRNPSTQFPEREEPIHERLATLCARLSAADMDRERALVRTAIMLLGPSYVAPFVTALRVVGIGQAGPKEVGELVRALKEWPKGQKLPRFKALISDLGQSERQLDSLLPHLLDARPAWPILLPALGKILEAQPHSLSAANLAGIEAYREPWEFEIAREAA